MLAHLLEMLAGGGRRVDCLQSNAKDKICDLYTYCECRQIPQDINGKRGFAKRLLSGYAQKIKLDPLDCCGPSRWR